MNAGVLALCKLEPADDKPITKAMIDKLIGETLVNCSALPGGFGADHRTTTSYVVLPGCGWEGGDVEVCSVLCVCVAVVVAGFKFSCPVRCEVVA